MEIRRFGVGHRRPDGPPRTTGVAGLAIHADARGVITELAFARGANMETHSNPNTTWFVVIEGGGWVRVGDETARVAAGEAVLWPAGVDHSAWTELSEMRAFAIELAGADDAAARGILEGTARQIGPGEVRASGADANTERTAKPPAWRGEGTVSRAPDEPGEAAAHEGEPR